MSLKELAIETLQKLPDDASMEQIAYQIDFMAAVQKGIADIAQGRSIPHEEVRRQMAAWLTE